MAKNILNIPKIKQLEGHCGVASLCMISAYFGKKKSQEKMAQHFSNPYDIREIGVWEWEIEGVAKKIGFKANLYEKLDFDDLSWFINRDSPIITKCLFYPHLESRHYYVVKGYDSKKQKIFINDPWDQRRVQFDYDFFKKLWVIKGKYPTTRCGIVISKNKII